MHLFVFTTNKTSIHSVWYSGNKLNEELVYHKYRSNDVPPLLKHHSEVCRFQAKISTCYKKSFMIQPSASQATCAAKGQFLCIFKIFQSVANYTFMGHNKDVITMSNCNKSF